MTVHAWTRTILAIPEDPEKPPVYGWVRCSTCGAQVCQMGYGQKAQMVYRVSANHEWLSGEPPCKAPEAEKTETPNELVERLIALVGRQTAIGLVAIAPCAVETCRAQEADLLDNIKEEDPGAYTSAVESLEQLREAMVVAGCLGWSSWAKHILNVLKGK